MKGVMFTAQGVTEIIDEPEPECGEDEVLLQTLYSGVSNGTERSFLTGGAYGGQKWPKRARPFSTMYGDWSPAVGWRCVTMASLSARSRLTAKEP